MNSSNIHSSDIFEGTLRGQGRWVGLYIPNTYMKLSDKTSEQADNPLHQRPIPNTLPAL